MVLGGTFNGFRDPLRWDSMAFLTATCFLSVIIIAPLPTNPIPSPIFSTFECMLHRSVSSVALSLSFIFLSNAPYLGVCLLSRTVHRPARPSCAPLHSSTFLASSRDRIIGKVNSRINSVSCGDGRVRLCVLSSVVSLVLGSFHRRHVHS